MNKDELLKIKENALERHIPIIMDDTLEVIDKYLTEKRPEKILEIGTAVGYSAMCFSEYLRDGGKIDTIERDEERIAEAKENIKKVGVEEKINIYEGDFLEHALRMLKDDGIIFADNILYKGYVMSDYNKHKQRTAVTHLRQYIKETTENPELETEILEVGDGLAITKKRIEK